MQPQKIKPWPRHLLDDPGTDLWRERIQEKHRRERRRRENIAFAVFCLVCAVSFVIGALALIGGGQ